MALALQLWMGTIHLLPQRKVGITMNHQSCDILFEAGRALVEKSGLASYNGSQFVACDNEESFDKHWKEVFHPTFGRYMAWVLFSVGAESLAKAACVCNKVKVSSNATLRAYTKPKGHFRELCRSTKHCDGVECILLLGYKRLSRVRNRDAHSYHKNVRSAEFPLVWQKFVPALNVAAEAMKTGGHPWLESG